MSNTNLGTLQTISYENLQQFIDAVNRNFAVVQNSPLFKGIPGDDAEPGQMGPQGIRGSKFIFIDFVKFQTTFPNEISTSAQIDLVFLNSKLSNNESKNLLLTALGVPSLVDSDVIVLTNSILLSYNFSENKFYDTKKSLSQSVTTDIENIIIQMFQAYLPILQGGIKNVFENFQTLAKNYSDNNNNGINTAINSTSVYSPFIPGITSNNGVQVPNHKYYGLSTNLNTETSDNTLVVGSIIKYYKLLMNTISTDGNQTLTSDYAPGVNNIPAAILLQDTYKNGLLLGYKGKQNLKTFGSIYKNESDELVIKSDSGKLPVDFSTLKIHKNYLKYNKLAQFNDSLEISQNLFVGGHYKSGLINSGVNAFNIDNELFYDTDMGHKHLTIGTNEENLEYSILQLRGEEINLPAYQSKVLVTDSKGSISDYITELTKIKEINNPFGFYIPAVELGIDGDVKKRVILTYHYNYLARKINYLYNNFIYNLYWTKSEFETNVIPNLKLNNSLTVDRNVSLAGIANFNNQYSRINFSPTELLINTQKITFSQFGNKFLIGDATGVLRTDVELMNNVPEPGVTYTPNPNVYKVLTDRHYKSLIDQINNNAGNINVNFWTKTQFLNFEIPNLTLNTGLFSKKYIAVNKTLNANAIYSQFITDENTVFMVDGENNTIKLGDDNGTSTIYLMNSIRFLGYNNSSLTTNERGTLLATPFIGNIPQSNYTITYANQLLAQTFRSAPDNLTIGSMITSIVNNYNSLKTYIDQQINNLSASFTTQLNNLANQLNQQITVINGDISNIYNILNTKANITYVDGITNNIITNLNNLTTVVNQNVADIAWIKTQLNTKVNQTDFNNLVNEFNLFKNTIPKIPKGLICLWEGVGGQAAIPEDWEEVTSLRGRVAVGWLNGISGYEFQGEYGSDLFGTIGQQGGMATHSLTGDQNGPHNHIFRYITYTRGTGGSTTPVALNGNHGTSGTENSGLGTPHNNTQPYRVLIYIRSKKGF